jgi:hypothetical protein
VPAQTVQTDGFVLLKQPPGDAFQTLSVFSAELGVITVLQRIGRKTGNIAPLDLFDEASFDLETSNQGRTYFIRETRVLTRRAELGKSYDTLRLASLFAAIIARNPVHEESRAGVAELLRRAFAAFATSARADIVYLKSLYRFARDEGYPLKEEWFPTLPAADRSEVVTLLNRPLDEQSAEPPSVARYTRRLTDYLREHTEIQLETT